MGDSGDRFRRRRPVLEELMRVGGAPGLSVAVMTRGELVYQDNFGYRDVEAALPVNNETIFAGASLTKAVTAAAFSLLVDEGSVTWDTPVKDLLPEFDSRDGVIKNCLTVTDLLSHRHGLEGNDGYAVSAENNCLIAKDDVMRFLNTRERVRPFRGQFAYNNAGYELVGKVIERLSGLSFRDFITKRIFEPLDMSSTYLVTPPASVNNVAKSYSTLDDGTLAHITAPKMGDDWWGGVSGGMRSNIVDMLKLYQFFLRSFNTQKGSSKELSLSQGPYLMSSRIPLESISRHEASYAMGWGRVQLPGQMGQLGINSVPGGMPIIGKGVPSQLVMFHQGSLAGTLAFVALLPDLDSIILVLSNSLALNDVPDWISSGLQNLLWRLIWGGTPESRSSLQNNRPRAQGPKPLEAYVGTYWGENHILKIVVTLEDGHLYRSLQGLEAEKVRLHHYENDTFTWLTSRNELNSRALFVGNCPAYWKLVFEAGKNGKIQSL
ncbi:hypothetical protein ONS95_008421 [Cadophora gregata]|uniref:uncharacterized protein n=1 Tax=Cadophora gregata TaxID=51156 RepID=UPI0026DAE0B4|nr:uncharacterized protein ONS95_008421 [Cadophora gregata]KAK0126842.1 hypothetical protein ONS95_008421 [Cadophora gregata]